MWLNLPIANSWLDPQKVGDKYESITNPNYILEYVSTDDVLVSDPHFIFNASTGAEVILDRKNLTKYYRRWVDPYAKQKAMALKDGWIWKDEVETPTVGNRVSF